MDKPRILPPSVRGRVTGVLDFFVDEIRLFRNILLLTNKYDLVLQVQWWGEVLPAFIRPKEFNVEGKSKRVSHLLESYYHCAQYEIKTTLDLFRSYLEDCEVLELSVYEAFENYVIGSAFLKDLINVLFSNYDLITLPIFDYSGEEIGEVIIHINFLQKSYQETDKIQNKNAVNVKKHVDKTVKKQDNSAKNKMKSDNFSVAEKTIFYDGRSKKNSHLEEIIIDRCLPMNLRKSEKITNSSFSQVIETPSSLSFGHESGINHRLVGDSNVQTSTCLPEIQSIRDSSKVLHFGVTSQKSKTDIKKPSMKTSSKFNSNSIKCKSKYTEKLGTSIKSLNKSLMKKTESCRNVKKISTTTKAVKQIDSKHSSASSDVAAKADDQPLNDSQLKQSPSVKVLDYLLGSDMSKEDEQTALNDFKKLSPSHNLVDSISQLCLISDKDSQKSVKKSSPRKQNVLNFDFNNPIERNYYETFFLQSNCPPDFEIAELLNQPQNSHILFGKPQQEIPSHITEYEMGKNLKFPKNMAADCSVDAADRRSNCSRCKYYKKLNELDTIIESLKHFEQKMLTHEKDLQSAFKDG